MTWLQLIAGELLDTVSNGEVWSAILLGLLVGGACLALGIWVTRMVGLLEPDAPAGETLGVGLASGLMVAAAWWATLWSGGRSSFTPVAVGFAIAIGLAVIRRRRTDQEAQAGAEVASESTGRASRWSRHRSLVLVTSAAGAFVIAVAMLYGSTMAPSPRDDIQPIEFTDVAFYAVLGADLAATGTEANYTPSGFAELPGLPVQTWYHWGELWLASAVITLFGISPMAARYFIVLPIVLLAAAAMTGTVVCRLAGTRTWRPYLFGFVVCLLLAPIPLVPGPFFSSWAVGLIFGITLYGLAAVAVVLALYFVAVLATRRATWALAGFVGSAVAFIVPAHLVIAALACIGIATVWGIRFASTLTARRRWPAVSPIWRRSLVATGVAVAATAVWGVLTGHGVAGSTAAPTIPPFNEAWSSTIAIIALGAGMFLTIPVAWFGARHETSSVRADLYVATIMVLLTGALAWGAKVGDFNMYHVFFAGIAVFATPVAAVAAWTLGWRLRKIRHFRLAFGVVVLAVLQLEAGVIAAGARLEEFGSHKDLPIPLTILDAIRALPPDAKLAYACEPLDESGFADPTLVGIDAHTGRGVVPMCFEADFLGTLNGAEPSTSVMNPSFISAPQRALYPDPTADPSSAEVANFMKAHGIHYIFVDRTHPNSLVDGTIPIATSLDTQLLRIP